MLLYSDTDTSPAEKEDIDLLERALEKALQVRTGAAPSRKDSNKQSAPQKEPGTTVVTSKQGAKASAASKGIQTTTRSMSKSAILDRKEHKGPGASVSSALASKSSASYNPGQCKTTISGNIIRNCPGILHHQTARKSQQAVSASGSLDAGQLHTAAFHSKNKTIRSSVLSGNDLGKAAAISMPSSNNTVPASHTEESGAHGLPQQKGYVFAQLHYEE